MAWRQAVQARGGHKSLKLCCCLLVKRRRAGLQALRSLQQTRAAARTALSRNQRGAILSKAKQLSIHKSHAARPPTPSVAQPPSSKAKQLSLHPANDAQACRHTPFLPFYTPRKHGARATPRTDTPKVFSPKLLLVSHQRSHGCLCQRIPSCHRLQHQQQECPRPGQRAAHLLVRHV